MVKSKIEKFKAKCYQPTFLMHALHIHVKTVALDSNSSFDPCK